MPKFKHAPADSYRREIEVVIPGDLGKSTKTKLILRFKRHNQEELKAILKRMGIVKDKDAVDAADTPETKTRGAVVDDGTDIDLDLVLENTMGWEGVNDENDQPVEFSAENLTELMGIPCYRRAMIRALLDDVLYPEGKKVKN